MLELMWGKRNHEAGIINGEGKQIGKTLRISNTMTGFQCLNDFIQDRIKKITGEQDSSTDELSVHIGMEATGHYWKTLYTYLEKVGYKISVINPIQTEKVRKVQSIRKAKTDKIDAIVIANTLRINQPEQSVFRRSGQNRYSKVEPDTQIDCRILYQVQVTRSNDHRSNISRI